MAAEWWFVFVRGHLTPTLILCAIWGRVFCKCWVGHCAFRKEFVCCMSELSCFCIAFVELVSS